MLDIGKIRESKETVEKALLKRNFVVDFSELLGWDEERKQLKQEVESLRSKVNAASQLLPKMKQEKQDTSALLAEMKEISSRQKSLEANLGPLEAKISEFLSSLPNTPADDVVAGGKEGNVMVREWGTAPRFGFKTRDHVELAKANGLVDYERGAKLGGHGFWIYKGKGAMLEWALLNYFIGEHIKDGYEFIMPPHILLYNCGYVAGQFPKFVDDVFKLQGEEGKEFKQFLLPTAETALVSLHADECLDEDQLPKKYFSYTPCYRREAGSYRTNERGTVRGHQFNKVEMVQYTAPKDSENAFNELVAKAERLVQSLGLHYRLSKLAAGDVSASMGRTCDIEVWIPSMNEYKEISSVSNAYDYQARRGNMRYKPTGAKKTEFLHTLNASGLATSRLVPAILEQFQNEDGSVTVPEVLRAALHTDVLRP